MKLVKPSQLGLLTRPLIQGRQCSLAVAVIGFFELGRRCEAFLEEAEQWQRVLKALPKHKPLDEVFPKVHGEWLLAGSAYAPAGQPVQQLDVSVRVGDVHKSLRVWGDRRWYYGPWYRQTNALRFLSMPLTMERAYGGPGHPANPEGRGYTGNPLAGWVGQNEGALPNIEQLKKPVRWHVFKGCAVGTGPLDPSKPPRRRYAGTFGRRWQQQDQLGLALNVNPLFFQTAPADQWTSSPWQGGEDYRLENLHPTLPVVEGQLPDMRVRTFARSKDSGVVREMEMAMDTVWFFPDQMLGAAVYHGKLPVNDPDILDVDTLLAAYERASQSRPRLYYEQALRNRTDPETAALHAMTDAPLIPVESESALIGRRARQQAQRIAADELRRARQQLWLKELGGTGVEDQVSPTNSPAESPDSPWVGPGESLDIEAVRSGDVDLSLWLADTRERTQALRVQAEQSARKAQSAAKAAAPRVDIGTEKQRLYEIASKPAWDLLNDHHIAAVDDSQFIGDVALEDKEKAHVQFSRAQVMQRQARRAALTPTVTALTPDLSAWLGCLVRHWLDTGVALPGRDLSGADLRGLDFSGADLRETIFECCDLRGAKFEASDLRGASFLGAQLAQANFSQARLEGANLSASVAIGARLVGADLRKAWAMNSDFSGCVLDNAVLSELMAHKLILRDASLRDVQAQNALMLEVEAQASRWDGAQLVACNLLKGSLPDSSWRGAYLKRCVLLDAALERADLGNATLEKCLAMGARLRQAEARSLCSVGSGWRGSDWTDADLSMARCVGSDFGDANMSRAILSAAVLNKCVLQGAKLCDAKASGADFLRALCRRADFKNADLRNSNFRQAVLNQAEFTRADLRGAKLEASARRRILLANERVKL